MKHLLICNAVFGVSATAVVKIICTYNGVANNNQIPIVCGILFFVMAMIIDLTFRKSDR